MASCPAPADLGRRTAGDRTVEHREHAVLATRGSVSRHTSVVDVEVRVDLDLL